VVQLAGKIDWGWLDGEIAPLYSDKGRPGIESWLGLFAPSTPKDIIGKLNVAAVGALADPSVQSRLAGFGMEIFPRERQTPQALGAFAKAEPEKWLPLIKEFGIKLE
jgi:tripartite-type tricarboxylate transporter receptor subunit TctC